MRNRAPKSITLYRSICAALVACAALAWSGCSGKKSEGPPAVNVQAATVQQKTISQIISTEAVLYPKSEASIVPKISAPVEKFYVNRGGRVKAGDLVAQLENKDLQAALKQAQGAFQQAQAAYDTSTQVSLPADIQNAQLDVKANQQAMESARLEYDSRQKLFQAGAISRNVLEQARVAFVQANNQYLMSVAKLQGMQKVGQSAAQKTAEGQLAAAKGQYEAAQAQMGYSQIRSPISGVVTDRPLYEGQMAAAGTPLITIMDLSHVVGRAFVSPEQASQLRVGDAATIVPGNSHPDLPAKVTVVSPALDPNSTTVQVWVEAANPGDQLRPGTTVNVQMVAHSVKNALVVPAAAILTGDGGATSVLVIGPDHAAHQTGVQTGIREGNEVQITSGVHAGQQVVTEGAYGLPDGTKVQVAAPPASAGAD